MATYQEAYAASLEYYRGDDLPAKTFVDKYALRDREGDFKEVTPDGMHRRLAKEFARIEKQYPNPRSFEEIEEGLLGFKYFVPQGSPMFGIGNPYSLVSFSNCFVLDSPKDSMSSIIEVGKNLANILKRRGGAGLDLSGLRPAGSLVNNAAHTSTGAWSFSDLYSSICRMVGQDGRRGALMLTLDVRHPDVFKFATMKQDKKKVTGANVSIKLNDEFMEAVQKNKSFTLKWPVDSENPLYTNKIKARDLWQTIIDSVHFSGEPGILMWDTILKELPAECYADVGFKHISTNPCGELVLGPEGACRLLSMNLTGFVFDKFQDGAYFDFKLFTEKVRLAQRMMDDLVDLELEAVENIINKVDDPAERSLWQKIYKRGFEGRRTGLGTFSLADTFAQLGLKYDTEEALEAAEKIYRTLRDASYTESVNMAEERGAFPVWDWEKEKDNSFLKRLPLALRRKMAKVGRRQIANLTNAPTGSVSICSFNSSSGIEPVFRNIYTRRKKINANDSNVRVDFIDEMGDRWQEFNVFHRNVADWVRLKHPSWEGKGFPELPSFFVTSDQINWKKRVRLQGVIQKYIEHSIASTVNLPADVSKETVGKLYLQAWKEGLKGVTIYVDGSRSGVLITSDSDNQGRPKNIKRTHAPKRPDVLPCDIYRGRVQGEQWTIVVGLLYGEPYELFGGPSEEAGIPRGVKSGFLTKLKVNKQKNQYDLSYNHYNEETFVKDIGNVFDNKAYGTFTRVLSLSLRHGAPVQHIVEQLHKDQSEELNSLSSVLGRALKKYIADGATVVGDKGGCGRCGGNNLRYQEGCPVCLDCGFARCN